MNRHHCYQFITIVNLTSSSLCILRMTEAPFMSRDRLRKYQEHFQGIQKHTYMKGRFDKITSVAIPLAFAASCLALIVSISTLICLATPRLSVLNGLFLSIFPRVMEFTIWLMELGRKNDVAGRQASKKEERTLASDILLFLSKIIITGLF